MRECCCCNSYANKQRGINIGTKLVIIRKRHFGEMVSHACRWANKSRLATMGDLSGVTYDKGVRMKLKSKLYKTVVRPVVEYWSECWALRKRAEHRLHTTEMKMLRWCQGKTRKDRIKNETISGIANITPI